MARTLMPNCQTREERNTLSQLQLSSGHFWKSLLHYNSSCMHSGRYKGSKEIVQCQE